MFQFTRPRGARQGDVRRVGERRVSIHAPTGGATSGKSASDAQQAFQFTRPRGARRAQSRTSVSRRCFNSRAHGGRDRRAGERAQGRGRFQFTRPRGARQTITVLLSRLGGFNSRAHGGRDVDVRHFAVAIHVSIHAPTGGATRQAFQVQKLYEFQFTRPRGARHFVPALAAEGYWFQFTRPRGARLPNLSVNAFYRCFNSRAHGGRDKPM